MAKPVVITTDSGSDIPVEIIEKYNIGVVPLHVLLDGADYKDLEEITAEDIFSTYKQKKILPTTSAVSISEYTSFFKKYTDEGASIVHIDFSSKITSCYQSARIAAEDLKEKGAEIHVVDSLSLSNCVGHMILKACDLREAGLSAKEISQEIEPMRDKLDIAFVINTLEFLKHGGRCSSLSAFGANILGIKPSIQIKDGVMQIGKKYRGKLDAVHLQFIDDKLSQDNIDYKRLFIAHTCLSEERLQNFIKHIKKKANFEEIYVSKCGAVITSHGAKDAISLGLLFK